MMLFHLLLAIVGTAAGVAYAITIGTPEAWAALLWGVVAGSNAILIVDRLSK